MDCGKNGLAGANDTASTGHRPSMVAPASKIYRPFPKISANGLNAAVRVSARSLLPERLAQIGTGSAVDAREGALSDPACYAQRRRGALLAQAG
jgi:hypothetical protein